MFLPWNDRRDATPIHAGDATHLERGCCKNATGVAQRNQGVGLAFVNQFCRAPDGAVAFLAKCAGGLVVHFHDFAGMDDVHAMVAKATGRQGGVNVDLIANQVNGGDFFVALKRLFDAFDDNTTPVIATHDIHSNSHRRNKGKKNAEVFPAHAPIKRPL